MAQTSAGTGVSPVTPDHASFLGEGFGIKTIEYRSRPTRIIGERFWIYVPLKPGDVEGFATLGVNPQDLPTGVIVGSTKITHCMKNDATGGYEWHLAQVERVRRPRKPKGMPQPVWFWPF